ncbi:IS3 family transposase [Paenibacillus sp. BR1-192]|uniref:IS3 family transposase n=1 Tax=Paenibacillus sp. BR1-192 TaxID=3032287 RepID=UPI00240DBEF2|nr:IS3 family transposase [Paenibacillus sp. BR1-192]WFB59566.1 IS3 family transposase [Paenibacillus sp. BR1-192]
MNQVSKELKESILQRMMPLNNEPVSQIARESGISETTLYKWKHAAKASGMVMPTGAQVSERWSTRDKFAIVVETAALSEIELSEYCRAKGLYVEQVNAWRDACMQANGGIAEQSSKLQKELRSKEQEVKELSRELQRKEAALAETAALLVLRKKGPSDLGGPRGRLISAPDRELALSLIQEAVEAGARERLACIELGLTQRTIQRWRQSGSREDGRPHAKRPAPAHKLSEEEERQILNTIHQPAFKSLPPSQIVPSLADQGTYIASESSFYRVMRKHQQQQHRGRSKQRSMKPPTSHSATGVNQVWMWDITWLPGPVKGLFFYLYLVLDLYSRKIVGWEIWEEESAEHASQLIRKTVIREQCVIRQHPLVLHSDNGSPMKGATLLETLYSLGITPSRSRPRVSNDNPYAESVFRTCKYRPAYPAQGFKDCTEGREWVLRFVHWYNHEHHHSGLNFLTPSQRHQGLAEQIFEKRRSVYETAKASHPKRWSGATRDWSLAEEVWLNPDNVTSIQTEQK